MQSEQPDCPGCLSGCVPSLPVWWYRLESPHSVPVGSALDSLPGTAQVVQQEKCGRHRSSPEVLADSLKLPLCRPASYTDSLRVSSQCSCPVLRLIPADEWVWRGIHPSPPRCSVHGRPSSPA